MFKITLFIISTIIATANLQADTQIDFTTDLIIDKGLSDVKENCTVCHTGRFIVVNGGDQKFWKAKTKTMQSAYGLWDLDETAETNIVNYLSKNYSKKVNVSLDD